MLSAVEWEFTTVRELRRGVNRRKTHRPCDLCRPMRTQKANPRYTINLASILRLLSAYVHSIPCYLTGDQNQTIDASPFI